MDSVFVCYEVHLSGYGLTDMVEHMSIMDSADNATNWFIDQYESGSRNGFWIQHYYDGLERSIVLEKLEKTNECEIEMIGAGGLSYIIIAKKRMINKKYSTFE